MPDSLRESIDLLWFAIVAIWLAAAIVTKPAIRKEPLGLSLIHKCVLLTAWLLFLEPRLWDWAPPFHWRVIRDSPAAGWIAFVLTFAGISFAVWARFYIGRNWSGTVTVKQDHELMRGGPYAIVRHPIYSGLSLALLGTAIAVGEVRGLLGAAIAVIEFKRKSLVEERFMSDQFGAQYEEYRRRVKGLAPGLW